jgi:hypothetical protein
VTTDAFEQSSAAMEAETTIRGLLDTACREGVELLDATACAISRVIGDLLVGLAEHTTSGRPLAHGHESLLAKLGFESLLMVCLPSSDSCWGLVELYAEHGHFNPERAELAARFAARVGSLLERLESPETL